MSRDVWSSTQYQRYAGHRGRPFFDLLAAVHATAPRRIADLGCGPGTLTATLLDRWPEAHVTGVDSSRDMLDAAQALAVPGRLEFQQGDLQTWRAPAPVDVIVSNAALQWVDGHRALLPGWIDQLTPGGWLAFQVPGNLSAPSHAALREVCNLPPWRERVGDIPRQDWIARPDEYLQDLVQLGCAADVWETTYLQVLEGPDAVLEWVKGTALRPVLAALEEPDQSRLLAEYGERLRDLYPPQPWGTVFPFRRVFAAARRP